ncbi:DUF418 domain-containing protein [Aurantiacibacter xanthus]|uniref:DUF418 domain-containing protein n=1 Tax=Aurantiacibacter xanthus TaxID=1784712 RepID=A0A3A1P8L3_9SPHN|nr:DUF418 domain-containing protein [Aurantiacibacter xanthus]RIV88449.1 DUF418 domain-containing protein [Aurantiacibacter xanthus]
MIRHRIAALDALRGVAVAGIVAMNVIAYAMPPAAYINPRAYGGDGPLATGLWALGFLLVEDKFRTLFAMMFGAGVTILIERGGAHPWRAHYARMAALFVIAMAHAVLLANNDVLRTYAVIGCLLPLFIRLPLRWLLIGAAALMLGQLAVSGYVAWGWLRYWHGLATGLTSDTGPLAEVERRFGADPQMIAASLAQWQESLPERIVRRMHDWPIQLSSIAAQIPSTLATMLVGVAAWRSGLLAGVWPQKRLFCLAAWLGVPSLVALAGMALWSIMTGFNAIVTAFNALVLSAPFDMMLGIAYAALAMALFGGPLAARASTRRWAAVGRMALTNYLGTSLVFAALFAAWGLGLFGMVTRGQALALGLIPVMLMLVVSPLWLSRFRQGPAEWLWRSLAALKPLPFRQLR